MLALLPLMAVLALPAAAIAPIEVWLPATGGRSPLLDDPHRLDFDWDYYLAENLALGLLREDPSLAGTHHPGLASALASDDGGRSWRFPLAVTRWSDGSEISEGDWRRYWQDLARHQTRLPRPGAVRLQGNELRVELVAPIPKEELIPILAAAGAALFHRRNSAGDWTITSGCYRQVDSGEGLLTATASCRRFARTKAPPHVRISRRPVTALRQESFSCCRTGAGPDVLLQPVFSFLAEAQAVIRRAPRQWRGFPTVIYYWSFGAALIAPEQLATRRLLQRFVSEAYRRTPLPSPLIVHREWYPRSPLAAPLALSKAEMTQLRKAGPFLLSWDERLADDPALSTPLDRLARRAGIVLRHRYGPPFRGHAEEAALRLNLYNANSKDAAARWRFLYSEAGGLRAFAPQVEEALTRRDGDRVEAIAMDEVHGIPFAAEATGILTSHRLQGGELGLFDQRLRFFEWEL